MPLPEHKSSGFLFGMKNLLSKFILFAIFLPFVFNITNHGVWATYEQKPNLTENISSKKLDKQAEILSSYLAKYNSPMQYHAQDFIDAADEYDLDWKMLPAIAGVESTFGKQIPGGYNAYGWGVYGTNRIYFKSWRDGMFTVAKGLRENYLNKGLQNPYAINRVYAASPYWGWKVTYFMNDLEKYAKNFDSKNGLSKIGIYQEKIAAISGLPTY